MSISIRTNTASLNSYQSLFNSTKKLNKSLDQASSGTRINSASDDAAAVSISDGLKKELYGRTKTSQSIQEGISILKTAEGSFQTIAEYLQRLRELTVQAANDTNTTEERQYILQEVQTDIQDIDRIVDTTKFNNVKLLDGSANQFKLQVGIESDEASNTINIGDVLDDTSTTALGLNGLNLTAAAGGIYENNSSARSFLDTIDNAIKTLNENRSQVGAYQNRLSSTLEESLTSMEGYSKSYSDIRDADIAKVTTNITKQNILRESALSIMMQANSNSSVALSLLAA